MESLIDLTDTQSNSQKPLPMGEFGMIRRKCYAIDVIGLIDSRGETLSPGTLIQITNNQRDECHFRVWELSNWLDKYKTTIYKCSKDDYVMVTIESLSYLLAIKRGADRVKFVQNIANGDFEVKMLKIGCELRIRGLSGTDVDYYEFIVAYNGVMEENGTGYYIGLQSKNDHVPIELKYLSQNYRFGGIGIVVPADWIMMNLYKEPECQAEPCVSPHHVKTSSVVTEGTEHFIPSIQQRSTLLDESNEISTSDSEKPSDATLTKTTIETVQPQRAFGIIIRAIDVAERDDSNSELLSPGTLIEINFDHRCHFKILDITNWLERSKTTTYKCSEDDYIEVTMELLAYLVTFENDKKRIKFVEKVSRREFDLGRLKVGREIRIRSPPGADVIYYEFVVTYNGIMEEKGIGHFIALQLKNAQVLSSKDLNCWRQNDRSGNTTFVVTADWIMLNLYKEVECQIVPPVTLAIENILPVDRGDPCNVIENDSESVRRLSTITVEPNQISETGARAEKHYRSSEFNTGTKQIDMPTNKVDFEVTQNNSRFIRSTSTPTENLNIISETGSITKPRRLSPDIKYDANQTNYATELDLISNADGSVKNSEKTKCDLCDKIVEIGSGIILRECLHSVCLQCMRYHLESTSNNSKIRCPYNKEYECKSDMWDVEIKDLGGDIFYNKILENRLHGYLAANYNSITCLNKSCNYTWYSSTNTRVSYEQCPKCLKSWHKVKQPSTFRDEPNEISDISTVPKSRPHSSDLEKPSEGTLTKNISETVQPQRAFGIIIRAIDVAELNDSNCEPLSPGALIEINLDYRADRCHFEILDITNWLERPKTTTYKCSEDDYIEVTMELLAYLVTFENDKKRIKFVENVSRREFDLGRLKVGREIRIRSPPGADVIYYEFVVTYNGIMEEKGIGHFIALQLKNEQVLSIKDLNYLGQNDRSGNTTFVVTADWIMSNLYKEVKCQIVPPVTLAIENILPVVRGDPSKLIENDSESVRRPSTLTVEPNKVSETGARAEKHYRSSEFNTGTKQIDMPTNTDDFEVAQNSTPTENLNIISETGTISKPRRLSPDIKYDANYANQTNYATELDFISNADGSVKNSVKTKCDLCDEIVEIGSGIILRECLHTFCLQCIRYHLESTSNNSKIRCPYNKEYECKSDLWDVEIKDLGGDIFYNEILENRLHGYLAANYNSRTCLNKSCNYTWYSSTNARVSYEECPKCMKSWHKSPQKPNERQEHKTDKSTSKTFSEWNWKSFSFTKKSTKTSTICVKCKLIISKSESIQLHNCEHTFCNDCIAQSIKTQTSGSLYASCEICRTPINDKEVTKITGAGVLKLFLGSREKQRPSPELKCVVREDEKTGTRNKLCICIPSTLNCNVVLKCHHKICRTYLKNKSPTACPICCLKIDEYLMKQLDGKMIANIIDKCPTCIKPADARLEKCGHSFCHNCVSDLIKKQTSDPSKMSINCTICNDSITESDISLYGGDIVLAQFKSKTEAARVDPKSFENVTLNDWKEHCASCKKKFSIKCCFILSRCRHVFCQACFNEFIGQQLSNSQVIKCPRCLKVLAQFEVDAILLKKNPHASNDFTNLVVCLRCETKIDKRLIHQCLKCASSLCLKCANITILRQIAHNRTPFCSVCEISLDESQIASIKKRTFTNEQSEELIDQNQLQAFGNSTTSEQYPKSNQCQKTNSEDYEKPDTCFECFRKLRQKIELKSCCHTFCRHCIVKRVMVQRAKGFEPTCPTCRRTIEPDEITYFLQLKRETHIPLQNKESRECGFCNISLNPFETGVTLKNCGHSFCSNCTVDVILKRLWNSQLSNCCLLCPTNITHNEFYMFRSMARSVFAGKEPNTS